MNEEMNDNRSVLLRNVANIMTSHVATVGIFVSRYVHSVVNHFSLLLNRTFHLSTARRILHS